MKRRIAALLAVACALPTYSTTAFGADDVGAHCQDVRKLAEVAMTERQKGMPRHVAKHELVNNGEPPSPLKDVMTMVGLKAWNEDKVHMSEKGEKVRQYRERMFSRCKQAMSDPDSMNEWLDEGEAFMRADSGR